MKFSVPRILLFGSLRDVLALLLLAAITSNASALPTTLSGQAYIDQCASYDVPIPPAWGSSGWTSRGPLDDPATPFTSFFAHGGADVEIFTYTETSPPGTCLAFEREGISADGDGQDHIDIICLGTTSSKACFWESDDVEPGEETPLVELDGGFGLKETEGGFGLICSDCHAGENPFIIHPGTPLSNPNLGNVDLFSDDWHDPIVPGDWPQNAGPTGLLETIPSAGECTECHAEGGPGGRFPELSTALNSSRGYCKIVLQNAIDQTMPPFSSTHPDPAYAAHANALLDMCNVLAKPILRVSTELLDYGEVELGFSFAKAIFIHNDGNTSLTVSVDVTTPSGDPNLEHWNEFNELANFTIDPGEPPAVLRQVYEPKALGPHQVEMEITSNDTSAPSLSIVLSGNGVMPTPIDTVLVLDRSGSMSELAGGQTKIDAMQNAAMLYTDVLRPDVGGSGVGDGIAFVKYNHNNSSYFPLTMISGGVQNAIAMDELSDAAVIDLNRLGPDGTTGIGGAMIRAVDELGSPVDDRSQVMVVLTDGKENEDPWIEEAIDDLSADHARVQVYSVGLGFDIEEQKLQSITNVGSEGYHQVTYALSDETAFDLETFYFKIFASAADMDMITDPTHVVDLATTNPIVVDRALVVSSDRSATFLVLDDPAMRRFYDVEFISPTGDVISSGSLVGGIPVLEQQRRTYRIFRIVFPDVSQADEYIGDWLLRIVPNGRWSTAEGKKSMAGSHIVYDGVIRPDGGTVPIGFAGAVSSNYRMDESVSADNYLPGAILRMSATLTDRGWPAADGEVAVTITRPDGTTQTIPLHDDGAHSDGDAIDATWSNTYSQTAQEGVYKLLFRALGRNERGELAPRLATRYVSLGAPEPVPVDLDEPGSGDGGCITCEGEAAAYLVGSFDLREERATRIHIVNPTAAPLLVRIALFDPGGSPDRCVTQKVAGNGLLEMNLRDLDPKLPLGVVKVLSLDPKTEVPVVGVVGSQIRAQPRGGYSETPLHPVQQRILKKDIDRIEAAC